MALGNWQRNRLARCGALFELDVGASSAAIAGESTRRRLRIQLLPVLLLLGALQSEFFVFVVAKQ
jgi:hypothetical protein